MHLAPPRLHQCDLHTPTDSSWLFPSLHARYPPLSRAETRAMLAIIACSLGLAVLVALIYQRLKRQDTGLAAAPSASTNGSTKSIYHANKEKCTPPPSCELHLPLLEAQWYLRLRPVCSWRPELRPRPKATTRL